MTPLTDHGQLLPTPTADGWIVPPEQRIPQPRDINVGAPAVPSAPPRIVLHTTEYVGYTTEQTRRAYARHAYPPQLWIGLPELNSQTYEPDRHGSRTRTAKWNSDTEPTPHLTILQRRPLAHIGWALKHWPNTPHTNHMGICAQIEIEGYAGDAANWNINTQDQIADIVATITRWINEHHDPTYKPRPYLDRGKVAGSWGAGKKANRNVPRKVRKGGSARMTATEWASGRKADGTRWGLCTHQNVPDNDHWDAGGLDAARIYRLAQSKNLTLLARGGPGARSDTTESTEQRAANINLPTDDRDRARQLADQIATAATELKKALS